MKTGTIPKTVADLLREGQSILAEQERQRKEQDEEAAIATLASWTALRRQAQEDLGELAVGLPTQPPEDFLNRDYGRYTLSFSPFNASPLFICYGEGRDNGWHLHSHKNSNDSFRVATAFRADFDDGDGKWYVRTDACRYAETLSFALALCYNATEVYWQCEQECQNRKPPKRTQQADSAPLTMTDAERNLMLALREWMAEKDD